MYINFAIQFSEVEIIIFYIFSNYNKMFLTFFIIIRLKYLNIYD